MSDNQNGTFQTISLGMFIALIVFNVRIYNMTAENPLEIYDSTHRSIIPTRNGNYIMQNPSKEFYSDLGKFCQCGDKIMNNICTEEQIISGCYDVSKNPEKQSLRHLSTECGVFKSELENNHNEYSKVFDLGFNMVHKMALGLLVVIIALTATIVLLVFVSFGALICGEGAVLCIVPCLPCILAVLCFSGLVNLILFIILMVNYYKGYTTGDFLDYYNDCATPSEKSALGYIFDDLDTLDSNMTAFVVLNFIGMVPNICLPCVMCSKKDE